MMSRSRRVSTVDQLEEEVIFSEWRRLRTVSSRSLARTGLLMEALDYAPETVPHRTLGVVGSKGKGTAAAYASAALAGHGERVGTVMSPGVISNADRLRIDGEVLDERTRRRALERILWARQELPPATADSGYLAPTGLFIVLGMLVFQELQVDVVVAEAGIGGASDDLSHWALDGAAVTGIFAEHLDLLGPTVADVAADKAAVITESTQFCVSAEQSAQPQAVLQQCCTETGTPLLAPSEQARELVQHLPAGFQRQNAAVGISAGLALGALARPRSSSWGDAASDQCTTLSHTVRSVRYPGRLSLHRTAYGRQCVVDSAVSGPGLAAALQFAERQLVQLDQVLVCLPPGKDLSGFIAELSKWAGRKVFVELPGAYTGMPSRSEWPWEWATQESLPELLEAGTSLAVGTVLYTSLVLRTLNADVGRLFTLP